MGDRSHHYSLIKCDLQNWSFVCWKVHHEKICSSSVNNSHRSLKIVWFWDVSISMFWSSAVNNRSILIETSSNYRLFSKRTYLQLIRENVMVLYHKPFILLESTQCRIQGMAKKSMFPPFYRHDVFCVPLICQCAPYFWRRAPPLFFETLVLPDLIFNFYFLLQHWSVNNKMLNTQFISRLPNVKWDSSWSSVVVTG